MDYFNSFEIPSNIPIIDQAIDEEEQEWQERKSKYEADPWLYPEWKWMFAPLPSRAQSDAYDEF